MAPINMSYDEMAEGFAGMLADSSRNKDAVTLVQGEATLSIPFGVMVAEGPVSTVQGTPDKAILLVDGTSKHAGILLHHQNYTPGLTVDDVGVKPKQLLSVLKIGRVYAYAEAGTYAKGQQLFVRHTANGAGKSQKGAIRPDADTASAIVNKGLTAAEAKVLAAPGYVSVDINIMIYRS